jgi:putative Mg2+ transporter-C (MgtC) family protein
MTAADQLEILTRLGWALGLGALIGAEREFRGNEAGLRTAALVCGGAALFGEVSGHLDDDFRLAAGVVQGIGFLGAGLMFREAGQVQNATTAVAMWVLAAIGLATASGLWIAAGGVAVGLLGLLELAPLSDHIGRMGKARQRDAVNDREQPERRGE